MEQLNGPLLNGAILVVAMGVGTLTAWMLRRSLKDTEQVRPGNNLLDQATRRLSSQQDPPTAEAHAVLQAGVALARGEPVPHRVLTRAARVLEGLSLPAKPAPVHVPDSDPTSVLGDALLHTGVALANMKEPNATHLQSARSKLGALLDHTHPSHPTDTPSKADSGSIEIRVTHDNSEVVTLTYHPSDGSIDWSKN